MNKPKLELEVNKPVKLKLLSDKPITGKNSYGDWYLYNVECEGTEYSFFAPKEVVDKFNELSVKKIDEVEITKTVVKSGKKNIVQFVVTSNPTDWTEKSSKNANDSNGGFSANGHSKEFKQMYNALKEAKEIKDLLGDGIDVNKIGISLYISKNR